MSSTTRKLKQRQPTPGTNGPRTKKPKPRMFTFDEVLAGPDHKRDCGAAGTTRSYDENDRPGIAHRLYKAKKLVSRAKELVNKRPANADQVALLGPVRVDSTSLGNSSFKTINNTRLSDSARLFCRINEKGRSNSSSVGSTTTKKPEVTEEYLLYSQDTTNLLLEPTSEYDAAPTYTSDGSSSPLSEFALIRMESNREFNEDYDE